MAPLILIAEDNPEIRAPPRPPFRRRRALL